jgi:hypothetical protein
MTEVRGALGLSRPRLMVTQLDGSEQGEMPLNLVKRQEYVIVDLLALILLRSVHRRGPSSAARADTVVTIRRSVARWIDKSPRRAIPAASTLNVVKIFLSAAIGANHLDLAYFLALALIIYPLATVKKTLIVKVSA